MIIYRHFCDCGPHFHCGQEIVHYICQECGTEYIGPDCKVTQPLPVQKQIDGTILCQECAEKIHNHIIVAV